MPETSTHLGFTLSEYRCNVLYLFPTYPPVIPAEAGIHGDSTSPVSDGKHKRAVFSSTTVDKQILVNYS